MLILSETRKPIHTGTTPPHYEHTPSKREIQNAAVKIIAHLTESAADTCEAEINILRRALCMPTN